MTTTENLSLDRQSAAFAALLEKLGTAFSDPDRDTQFSAAEAACAGAFEEDAINEHDVKESVDGH